jgi:hypothetical protein
MRERDRHASTPRALVAIEQNNVAGFSLLLAHLQTQAHPFNLLGDQAALQGALRSPPTELFCNAWTVVIG